MDTVPALTPATPVALYLRDHEGVWQAQRAVDELPPLTEPARHVLSLLRSRGASFFRELLPLSGLDADQLQSAIGVLAASGLACSDGFAGLRALVWHARGRPLRHDRRGHFAGRWTATVSDPETSDDEAAIELQARVLLRRYGVVFRRLLTREPNVAAWRDLARVYRRLEARGEIRGGRFVTGMSGEQFALPDAVERLREVRRTGTDGALVVISAADPLNLAGIVTAGERIRAATGTRIVYGDGVPLAVVEAGSVRELAPTAHQHQSAIARALSMRRLPALAS
jgi:ATP-dependent Lhr-like helicase